MTSTLMEAVERGDEVSKKDFESEVPDLRVDLLNAQFDLRERDFSVVILIAGDDRVACEAAFDRLYEWMDARYLDANAFDVEPSEEERERPPFWRYVRCMPPHGIAGVFYGAWGLRPVAARVLGETDDAGFEVMIEHVRRLERMMVEDGALLVKLWFHSPKKVIKKRLKRAKKAPESEVYVEERDWKFCDVYDDAMPFVERYLHHTDTVQTPWTLIEAADERHRDLTMGRAIRDAIVARLAAPPAEASVGMLPAVSGSALAGVDLTSTIGKKEYKAELATLQAHLGRLAREAQAAGTTTVMAFEGWDAGGKGGAIRRVTQALSARNTRLVPIAAPTDEERARHYLWRFWRHLPRAGKVLIFDRTWYGRVLVERVEGFATQAAWSRAYDEIRDFEEQLVEHGMVVLKFWMHISRDEQLRRFEDRKRTPYKKHKITDEDYRNRDRWDDYVTAVDEMVARTSTDRAPWHLVPANDKRFARIHVLRTVCAALEGAL